MIIKRKPFTALFLMLGLLLTPLWGQAANKDLIREKATMDTSQPLDERQLALVPVAAFAAAGELNSLKGALNQALEAGMTVNDGKEVLVQLYAYAGFPRSLNALGTFMGVLAERREQGIEDAEGDTPQAPIPTGDALLKQGKANQTELAGGPVKGPLFEFAPAADEYARLVGVPREALSPQVFAENPVLVRNSALYHVRAIQEVQEGGALSFLSAIDEGLLLTLGKGQEIVKTMAQELDLRDGRGRSPEFILGFDCVLRRIEIDHKQLTRQASEVLRDRKVLGFNTYGEQHCGVHVNQTFVGVAFFEPKERALH